MLGRPKMAYYIEEEDQLEEENSEEVKDDGFDNMFANFSNSQTRTSMANVDQKAVKNESRLRQSVKQAGA